MDVNFAYTEIDDKRWMFDIASSTLQQFNTRMISSLVSRCMDVRIVQVYGRFLPVLFKKKGLRVNCPGK